MDYGSYITYYTGLFAVQITLATIIAAGILAWYQLSEKQVPKRKIGNIINPWLLAVYLLLSLGLAIFTGLMSWSLLGDHDIVPMYDFGTTGIALSSLTTLVAMLVTIILAVTFFWMLWRTRDLIDAKRYLQRIGRSVDYKAFSDYLFSQYSHRPFGHIQIAWVGGKKKTKKEKEEEARKTRESELKIAEWEERHEAVKGVSNPIDSIIEYCRANSLSESTDVERIALPLLSQVLVEALEKDSVEEYLVKYVDDITDDMSEALAGSSIMVKKAFINTLYAIAAKYCNNDNYADTVEVAKNFHKFTRGKDTEYIKTYAISKLDELTLLLKERTKNIKEWRDVYLPMEGIISVGARISEDYFYNIQDVAPISIIESSNHENDDLVSVLGNLMYRMSDMHRDYPDAVPIAYFNSIYVVSLSLQSAIARSASMRQGAGLTRSRYEQVISGWSYIFYDHARSAISVQNKDSMTDAVYNLLRLLDGMEKIELSGAILDCLDVMIDLGARMSTDEWARDQTTYGSASIIDEIVDRVLSHPDQNELYGRKNTIEHSLFDEQFKEGYAHFMNRIGW